MLIKQKSGGKRLILKTKQDIIKLIEADEWMMDILKTVQTLNLPDWWVCAGFVRSKIWDVLHEFTKRTPLPDVDVIYFDQTNISAQIEKQLEGMLLEINNKVPWSVKNEARMHVVNNIPPYLSSIDAMSKFPETATALGVSINEQNEIILAAPCGIEDVLSLVVKPTPYFRQSTESLDIFYKRIAKKNWQSTWSKIKVGSVL